MDTEKQEDYNDFGWRRDGGETRSNFVAVETVAKERTEAFPDREETEM